MSAVGSVASQAYHLVKDNFTINPTQLIKNAKKVSYFAIPLIGMSLLPTGEAFFGAFTVCMGACLAATAGAMAPACAAACMAALAAPVP